MPTTTGDAAGPGNARTAPVFLALLALAQGLFYSTVLLIPAVAATGLAYWLTRRQRHTIQAALWSSGFRVGWRTALCDLTVMLAVAAFFRLWKLETIPPGLYVDEVLTARNALLWRLGQTNGWFAGTPLWVEGWVETANLYLAWVSGVLWLFGDGFWGTRIISVIPSLACVPLVYWLGCEMANRRVALAAGLFLAVSHWASRTGRCGWDQVAMTALQLGALACLARGLRTGRAWWSLAAGVFLGACLHTYIASRLVLAQIAVWLGWEWLAAGRRRPMRWNAALCLATALVLAAPHYTYLLTRSGDVFNIRTRQLVIGNEESHTPIWRTLATNVVAHLAMFNGRGGVYARDNLPGRAMLDAATGVLLLAGIPLVVGGGQWPQRLMISWYAVCVLGGVLSESREGPPYVYRVANLAPWACLVAAVGAVAWSDQIRPLFARRRWLCRLLPTAVCVTAAGVNFWILFVKGPQCPDFGTAFGTVETRVGLWLARHPQARPAYVWQETLKGLEAYQTSLWYEWVNKANWFEDKPYASIACVHLAAGRYRHHPERAIDPLAQRGDIDLVSRLPPDLRHPAVFVVPTALADEVRKHYEVASRDDLTDELGRALCTVLLVRPR